MSYIYLNTNLSVLSGKECGPITGFPFGAVLLIDGRGQNASLYGLTWQMWPQTLLFFSVCPVSAAVISCLRGVELQL